MAHVNQRVTPSSARTRSLTLMKSVTMISVVSGSRWPRFANWLNSPSVIHNSSRLSVSSLPVVFSCSVPRVPEKPSWPALWPTKPALSSSSSTVPKSCQKWLVNLRVIFAKRLRRPRKIPLLSFSSTRSIPLRQNVKRLGSFIYCFFPSLTYW